MKKLLMLITLFITGFNATGQTCNGITTLQGRQFMCGGAPFYPLICPYSIDVVYGTSNGINVFNVAPPAPLANLYMAPANFYGTGIDMSQFGPNLSPPYFYPNGMYETYNPTAAANQIVNDLTKIKAMGFNCIRTHNFPGVFKDDPNNAGVVGFYFTPIDVALIKPYQPVKFNILPPYYTLNTNGTIVANASNQELLFCFNALSDLLGKCDALGLKVIFDVGYNQLVNHVTSVNDYADYLTALAAFVRDLPSNKKNALLAYVIIEEPLYEGTAGIYSKNEICNITTQLYDALKTQDNLHFVTIGGSGLSDIFDWDPAVMKLDFYSPHIYPKSSAFENWNKPNAVDRVKDEINFTAKNCPMPWLIGETGFAASDDYWCVKRFWIVDPNYAEGGYFYYDTQNGYWGEKTDPADPEFLGMANGNLQEQLDYATTSLAYVRNSQGSGYTWWLHQESWGGNPLDGYGLARHGVFNTPPAPWIAPLYNPNPGNYVAAGGSLPATIEKPAAAAFNQYLNTTGQNVSLGLTATPTSNYFNFNHGAGTVQTSQVVDQNGFPIEDAVVQGSVYIYTQPPFKKPFYSITTFTDANGNFNLLPYNSLYPNYNIITDIRVTCAGCEVKYFHPASQLNPVLYLPTTIELYKNTAKFDNNINSMVYIQNNTTQNFSANNTILVDNNFTVEGAGLTAGGTTDLKAKNEITIKGEFVAQYGSEAIIHTGNPLPDCSLVTFRLDNNTGVAQNQRDEAKNIELAFKTNAQFSFDVLPNPNNGIFEIAISPLSKQIAEFYTGKLYDLVGNCVLTTAPFKDKLNLNLTQLAKGFYYITLYSNNKQVTQKLIIQ